ncbi:MAG: sodium:solute symporter [Acidobacteriota bacterium]
MIEWATARALPLAVVTVYTVIMIFHAWRGHRLTRGVADFYVGGRAMGGVVLGVSFYATYFSTNSFVGFAGVSYLVGFAWLAMGLVLLLFAVASWHLVAPRLRQATEELGALTVAEYLGAWYRSRAVRLAAAAVIVVSSLFYMVAIFKGIGGTLQAYLSIPYEAGIGLVFLIVVLYTVFGGFISVVHTDAVQGTLMLLGSFYLLAGVVRAGGGWTALLSKVASTPGTAPDGRSLGEALLSSSGTLPWAVLLGIACAGGAKFLVEPRQISRFFALRDERALRVAMIVAPAAIGLSYLCLLPLGVLARGLLTNGTISDTDLVIPTLLTNSEVMGPVASVIILTALLGAAMSSLDSVLLVVAGAFQRDVVEVLGDGVDERHSLRRTRWQVVIFAVVTALVALRPPGDILSLTVFSGSLYGACFGPPLFGALYGHRCTARGVIWTMLVGATVVMGWGEVARFFPFLAQVQGFFPSVGLATLVYLAACSRSGEAAAERW